MDENIQVLFEMGKIAAPKKENALVFCRNSKIGAHKCSVKTRYGWCCDVCLEDELLRLYAAGVHTVNSCCGHGNFSSASILVAGEESAEKMREAGYKEAEPFQYGDTLTSWVPKSALLYIEDGNEMEV